MPYFLSDFSWLGHRLDRAGKLVIISHLHFCPYLPNLFIKIIINTGTSLFCASPHSWILLPFIPKKVGKIGTVGPSLISCVSQRSSIHMIVPTYAILVEV